MPEVCINNCNMAATLDGRNANLQGDNGLSSFELTPPRELSNTLISQNELCCPPVTAVYLPPKVAHQQSFNIDDVLKIESVLFSPEQAKEAKAGLNNLIDGISRKLESEDIRGLDTVGKVQRVFRAIEESGLKPCSGVRCLSDVFVAGTDSTGKIDCDTSALMVLALAEKYGWKDVGMVVIPGHAFIRVGEKNVEYVGVKDDSFYRNAYGLRDEWVPHALKGKEVLALSHWVVAANSSSQNPDQIIEICNAGLQLRKEESWLCYERGRAQLEKGKFKQAISDFSSCLQFNADERHDLDDALAYQGRGIAYSSSGRDKKALSDYSEAIKLYERMAKLYLEKAEKVPYDYGLFPAEHYVDEAAYCFAAKGELHRARYEINNFKKNEDAANQDLKEMEVCANWLKSRGTKLMEEDKNSKAVECFSKALAINAGDTELYLSRAEANMALGKSKEAADDASRVVEWARESNENRAQAHCLRGLVRMEMKDYSGAIGDYTDALKLSPNNAEAYYCRGLAKVATGDRDGATVDYKKALELDPELKDFENYLE